MPKEEKTTSALADFFSHSHSSYFFDNNPHEFHGR
jgi:hypothetical protein